LPAAAPREGPGGPAGIDQEIAMMPPVMQITVPGAMLLSTLAGLWGGWATTSIEDLPDYHTARQPLELTFTVRQHGVEPMRGLSPVVEARSGRFAARADAATGRAPGQYTATLSLPEAGDWTVTVHNGFGRGKHAETEVSLRVVAPGAPAPAPLTAVARGQRLFVAKGCVTCHVDIDVGPKLAGRRFDADYLSRFLADPQAIRGASVRMPNLGLRPQEISSLVAFVNGGATGPLSGK
jgi:cytochrome c2